MAHPEFLPDFPRIDRTEQAHNFMQQVKLREFYSKCATIIGMPTPEDEEFANSINTTLKDIPFVRPGDSLPPSSPSNF